MSTRELNKTILEYVRRAVELGDYEVSGFRLLMRCPLPECQEARKQEHFYVNREWYGWKCYRQGVQGSLRDLVLANPLLWAPVRSLDDRGQARLSADVHRLPDDLVPLTEVSDRIFASHRRRAYEYALRRGISPAQIHDYKLAVKQADPRLWFPFWTPEGETVFRMGRLIETPGDPPVEAIKTWDEGVPDKPLYGSHVRKPTGFLALVEGVVDHFVTPHSCSLMGSTITTSQADTVEQWCRDGLVDRVFGLFDPDAKDKARREILKLRRRGVNAAACFLERTDSDPGKLGAGVMGRVSRALGAVACSTLASRPFLTLHVPPPAFATP